MNNSSAIRSNYSGDISSDSQNPSSKARTIRGKYSGNSIGDSADQALEVMRNLIRQEMQLQGLTTASSCELRSAVVDKVYEDGSVDVYFPPDREHLFTKISNQTSFALQVGDAVEITLKNGSFSNCWVSARHNTKDNLEYRLQECLKEFQMQQDILENKTALARLVRDLENFQGFQEDVLSTLSNINNNISSLANRISALETEVQSLRVAVESHEVQIGYLNNDIDYIMGQI